MNKQSPTTTRRAPKHRSTHTYKPGDEVVVSLGTRQHRAVVVGQAHDRVRVNIYVNGADPDSPLTSTYLPEELTAAS